MSNISVCVGCGLEVTTTGVLQSHIKPNAGLTCSNSDGLSANVGCGIDLSATGQIEAHLKANGGLGCDPVNGLFINLAPTADGGNGLVNGCGLTASEGKIALKLATPASNACAPTVQNLLTCDTTNGLHAYHQGSIASNSGVCGTGSAFLESSGLPMTLNAGQTAFLHSPLIAVKPYCSDATLVWAGNTIFDIAGLVVDEAGGGLTTATFELYQSYAPGPIVFGPLVPLYRQTIDNRFRPVAQRRQQDLILHDTTFQAVSGGQTLYFQFRAVITQVNGSAIINKFAEQQFEVTWHYSHVYLGGTGNAASAVDQDFNGCG